MPRARQNNERKVQQPKQEPEPEAEPEPEPEPVEKVKEPKVKAPPKPKPKKEKAPPTDGDKETASQKRKSTGQPEEASLPKRQKLETPKISKEERASEAFLNANIVSRSEEIDTVLLSIIKERHGVLEVVPRLDNLYKAHVQIHFPDAQARPDAKTLLSRLDLLEESGHLHRFMLT